MPVATSSAELDRMIDNELQKAMGVLRSRIQNVMQEEVNSFYSQGKPKIYPRTGNLQKSPKIKDTSNSFLYSSFTPYLEYGSYDGVNAYLQSLGYVSRFTPQEAFTAAENHTSRVKGKSGFWRRSQIRFEEEMNSVMRSYFN